MSLSTDTKPLSKEELWKALKMPPPLRQRIPVDGELWCDSNTMTMYVYDGIQWRKLQM